MAMIPWTAQHARGQCIVWSPLDDWVGRVEVLTSHDDGSGPALYVGGGFLNAGIAAENIARWDGSAWSAVGGGLGGGLTNTVLAFAVFDDGTGPALFAGGDFATAGGTPANGVAKWNGATWAALGGGLIGPFGSRAMALAVFDDGSGPALYAGGSFTAAGGLPVSGIARWNGVGWSAVGAGLASAAADLAVFDDGTGPALFAGGAGLSKWNGTSWVALPGVTGSPFQVGVGGIDALAVFDAGTGPALFAAGAFTAAGGTSLNNVARWDGTNWTALGAGISGLGIASMNPARVVDLDVFDDGSGPALYAGGWFTLAGGAPALGIAAWDGLNWSDVGGGANQGLINGVFGFTVHDDGTGPALFAGGLFTEISGVTAGSVAKWQARPAPSTYCTAGTTSQGCTPVISATGTPSASASSGFMVTVSDMEPGRFGKLIFGTGGPAAAPWGSGSSFLCVRAPLTGTGIRASGTGAGTCGGSLDLDFNAWMAAHPSTTPGLGAEVWMQAWFRDRGSSLGTGLSDGLTFFRCP